MLKIVHSAKSWEEMMNFEVKFLLIIFLVVFDIFFWWCYLRGKNVDTYYFFNVYVGLIIVFAVNVIDFIWRYNGDAIKNDNILSTPRDIVYGFRNCYKEPLAFGRYSGLQSLNHPLLFLNLIAYSRI